MPATTGTLPLPTPEWDYEADAWFRRYVTAYLREHLDEYYHGADDPELVAAVADAMLAQRAQFVRWRVPPWYDPEVGSEGRWEVDEKVISNGTGLVWELAHACEQRLRAQHEAQRFPDLDVWLAALHRGELEKPAHYEAYGGRLVTAMSYSEFRRTRSRRLQRWPRVCRACDQEFRGRANATECSTCKSGKKRTSA